MIRRADIHPGSTITIRQHTLYGRNRTGQVLRVLGGEGRPCYRVRWEDGCVSTFAPGDSATIESVGPPPGGRAAHAR